MGIGIVYWLPEHDEKLNIFCHPKITVDFSHLPNLNMVPTYIAVNSRCKQLIITSPAKLEGPLHCALSNNFALCYVYWGFQMWQARFEPGF